MDAPISAAITVQTPVLDTLRQDLCCVMLMCVCRARRFALPGHACNVFPTADAHARLTCPLVRTVGSVRDPLPGPGCAFVIGSPFCKQRAEEIAWQGRFERRTLRLNHRLRFFSIGESRLMSTVAKLLLSCSMIHKHPCSTGRRE